MTLNPLRQKDLSSLIGATAEAVAANPSAVSGINGLIRGLWTDFRARIPTLVNGAIPVTTDSSAASSVVLATVNVTTTSAVLFASNTNRIFWTVEYKSGSGEAYITEGAVATAANGKAVSTDYERGQDVRFTGAINCIGTVASGTAVCALGTTEYIK